jgi:hypothetical protein
VLFAGISIVQTRNRQHHFAMGIGLAELTQRFYQTVGGLIGQTNGDNHQMRKWIDLL